jgi:hypothetical protein
VAKHGGKRHGAGRKHVLTADEQLAVWQQCEEIRRAMVDEHHERQKNAYWMKLDRPSQGLFMAEVQRSWVEMDGWSPKQRKAALRRRGREGDEFADNLSRLEAVRTENVSAKFRCPVPAK